MCLLISFHQRGREFFFSICKEYPTSFNGQRIFSSNCSAKGFSLHNTFSLVIDHSKTPKSSTRFCQAAMIDKPISSTSRASLSCPRARNTWTRAYEIQLITLSSLHGRADTSSCCTASRNSAELFVMWVGKSFSGLNQVWSNSPSKFN